MKSPGAHISVEIREVGIVHHRLVRCLPAETFTQSFGEGGLTAPDVARNEHEMLFH